MKKEIKIAMSVVAVVVAIAAAVRYWNDVKAKLALLKKFGKS